MKELLFWIVFLIIMTEGGVGAVGSIMTGSLTYGLVWAACTATLITIFERWIRG